MSRPLRALAVSVALLLAAWCLREDAQPDLYFHLACGERILADGLPRTNVFLAPHPEHPFVAHEWFFQVASVLAWKLGGAPLLTLLKTIGVAVALAFIARASGSGPARWLVLIPAIVVAGGRFVLRPEVVTLLGVALHLFLVPRLHERRARITLLAFQVLWSSSHGYALLGPALTGAALAGSLLARKPAAPLARLLALETLLALVNPYGLSAALYPLLHLGQASQGGPLPIVELLSPFDPALSARVEVRVYRAWLLCAPLLAWAGRRRLGPERLAMGTLLVLASLPYVRHLALGAAGLAVLSGPGLEALLREWTRTARALAAVSWTGAALALGLTFLTLDDRFHENVDYDARTGVGLAGFAAYDEAGAFLERSPPAGGLFNTFGSGHWLLWARGATPPRPFICGNLDLYPREHLALYHRMLGGEVDFGDECERRGITDVLLDHRVEVPPTLIAALHRDPRWTLVHADPKAVLFRRAGARVAPFDLAALTSPPAAEEPVELLPLRALRALRLLPERGARPLDRLHLARLLLLLGRGREARDLARSARDLAPDGWLPGLAVGAEVERRAGDPAKARELLVRHAEEDPRAASPWLELGQLELASGRGRAAAHAFQEALRREPAPAERRAAEENLLAAWEAARDPIELRRALAARPPRPALQAFYRGAAALLEAELDRAEAGFAEALAADPGLVPAHQRIGEARYLRGDLPGAEEAYARITTLAPTDASGWRDLGVVRQQRGDEAGALAAWAKAGEVNPKETSALLYAAKLLRTRGQTGQARDLARQVLARDPQRAEAKQFLNEQE